MPRHELHELVVGFFFLFVQQPCRAVVKAPGGAQCTVACQGHDES